MELELGECWLAAGADAAARGGGWRGPWWGAHNP